MADHKQFLSGFGGNSHLTLQEKAVIFLLALATLVIYLRITGSLPSTSSKGNNNTDNKDPKISQASSPAVVGASSAPPPENCAWEERRKRGIVPHSSHGTKQDAQKSSKPFGSKYYYAHNNSSSKGGYSDGLRMEDFTMNKPRLLSRSDTPAELEQQAVEGESNENEKANINQQKEGIEENPSVTAHNVTAAPKLPQKITKDITRYLWDDPGDSSGVATLRIESLPGNTSTDTISWKDANICSVTANLEGDGLLVIATSEDDEITYRLSIAKLYDKASEVRTISKPKRLLVKIHKKRNALNFLGKSNLEAWPHPQRKFQ